MGIHSRPNNNQPKTPKIAKINKISWIFQHEMEQEKKMQYQDS